MSREPLILDGQYRLVRPVGSGGTANVYLANEVASGRKVAVKVLRKNLVGSPEMKGRFAREAALLSKLNHPNIVRLLRYEVADEVVLLILEWVDGRRLDQVLQEGQSRPLAAGRVLMLLRQLASALAAIHDAGVVHRDLKPENVMLEGEGREERLRLLDFGISRFADPKKAKHLFMSQIGHVSGTPSFMSPEQARGEPADTRTDVYAFGVLGYLLLSGRVPFSGKNDYAVLKMQIEDDPPPLNPPEPGVRGSALEALVMQCLAKKPKARRVDGRDLTAALQGNLLPRHREELVKD